MTTINVTSSQPNAVQQAVDAAAAGDTIVVTTGATYDPLSISKNIRLEVGGATFDAKTQPSTSAIRVRSSAPGTTIVRANVRRATAQNFAGVMVEAADVTILDLDFQSVCFGVRIFNAPRCVIRRIVGRDFACGVERHNVSSVDVDGWDFRDAVRMVVNTNQGGDNGGNAFQFYGTPSNEMSYIRNGYGENLRADSIAYGTDGGAFEFFGGGRTIIDTFELHNSVNIAETGKNAGMGDCVDVTIRNGKVFGRPGLDGIDGATARMVGCHGIVARDAVDWLVENLEVIGLDHWVINGIQDSAKYAGVLSDFSIRNVVAHLRDGVNRWMSLPATLPPGFASTSNVLVVPPGNTSIAARGSTEYRDLLSFQTATGLEAGSRQRLPGTDPPDPPTPTPPAIPSFVDLASLRARTVDSVLKKALQPVSKYPAARENMSDYLRAIDANDAKRDAFFAAYADYLEEIG